jgi:single-stranded-DNA-specific exonuclease
LKPIIHEWVDPSPVEIPEDLLSEAGGNTFLAEALARREIQSQEDARIFLNPGQYSPAEPSELPDLSTAVGRIQDAIHKRERIGIWGDFDVDGQTSTTLLVAGLRRLGADLDYHIPVRAHESHGVNISGLNQMLNKGVQLVVTCDTGITAHDAVQWARKRGVDTIITDHHSLPDELPPALAAVNPQRLPASHPLFPLCGVGCAYKVVEELHRQAGRLDELEQDLDLVMMGTVADLAVLKGENRFLVWKGLQQIRQSRRPAINALLETANTKSDDLTEEHVSFTLAPRLNALGRLGDANPIVDFFLSPDFEQAKVFSYQLEGLNARRKLLCDQVFRAAQIQIENDPKLLDQPVLVLNHPEWPAGVIGIVASRLVEQFRRPVVLISSPPGEISRGSARSVEGLNITRAIAAAGSLLEGYGGHPMAAGLGILPDRIPQFRLELSRTIDGMLAESPLKSQTMIDAYVAFDQLSFEIIQALDRLAPFGPGNPPLILASRNVQATSVQTIGRGNEHLKITLEDESGNQRAVLRWNGTGLSVPAGRFDLAYTVRAVNFRGQNDLQITWIDARVLEETIQKAIPLTQKIRCVDLRFLHDPEEAFRQIEEYDDAIIWREGEPALDFPGVGRHNLTPCTTLVFWNSPPGISEMRNIIEKTSPRQIVFLDFDMPSDDQVSVLTRLGGLVKHVIAARHGDVYLNELVGATNQREATIITGLEWLSAKGFIQFSTEPENQIHITTPGTTNTDQLPELEKAIFRLLKETKAFRDFYRRVDLENFVMSINK